MATHQDLDLDAATAFLATHGRLLDRRRLRHLCHGDDADGVLAALEAHRNPDGGYGWGIEPDLRDGRSQPTGAMHAFEALAEVGPVTSRRAVELCDWLAEVTLADGGLPFALPIADPVGCAPWWVDADATASAIQMTTQVAAQAHRVARHDPGVAAHPWLARATSWCLEAIAGADRLAAYELSFSLRFLDAVAPVVPAAADLARRLGAWIPDDGVLAVAGGLDGESLHVLDLAPRPGGPARSLFTPDLVAADLDRLAALQQPDGGWTVDFASRSPMAELEWRGYQSVAAVAVLLAGP